MIELSLSVTKHYENRMIISASKNTLKVVYVLFLAMIIYENKDK